MQWNNCKFIINLASVVHYKNRSQLTWLTHCLKRLSLWFGNIGLNIHAKLQGLISFETNWNFAVLMKHVCHIDTVHFALFYQYSHCAVHGDQPHIIEWISSAIPGKTHQILPSKWAKYAPITALGLAQWDNKATSEQAVCVLLHVSRTSFQKSLLYLGLSESHTSS